MLGEKAVNRLKNAGMSRKNWVQKRRRAVSLFMQRLNRAAVVPAALVDLISTVQTWEISSGIFSEICLAAVEDVVPIMDR